jgi:Leucine-rich repeat (LRR) protein
LNLTEVPINSTLPETTPTLLLDNNSLFTLRNNSFTHLPNLRELDVSLNLLSVLEVKAFAGLGQLVRLSLRGNNLTLSPDTYPDLVFASLSALKVLDISCNNQDLTRKNCREVSPQRDLYDVCVKADEAEFAPITRHRPQSRHEGQGEREAAVTAVQKDYTAPRSVVAHASDTTPTTKGTVIYPDIALSQLTSLRCLFMDGLTNQSLGPGFAKLTNLTHLDLNGKTGYCKMNSLGNDTLLSLGASLQRLNLTDCDIRDVEAFAFGAVPLLRRLDLSFNQALGFQLLDELAVGLNFTELEILHVDAVVPARSRGITLFANHTQHFRHLQHLRRLWARFNRLEAVEEEVLCGGLPPSLRTLHVEGNLFQMAPYVNAMYCLKTLHHLYVDGLRAGRTPPLRPFSDSQANTFSRHRVGDAAPVRTQHHDYSDEPDDQTFSVPPMLRTLSASCFCLDYKLVNVKVNATNQLTQVDLSQNYLPTLYGPLDGFHSVIDLNLASTLVQDIDFKFFPSFPRLQRLNISYNMLSDVFYNDVDGQLLRNLSNLETLDIASNQLLQLNSATFRPLTGLRELYLGDNHLESFNVSLDHMTNLSMLDLYKNMIRTLPKEVRDHLDWLADKHNVTVDLTMNHLQCDCFNKEFLDWYLTTRVHFQLRGPHKVYLCFMEDGTVRPLDSLESTIRHLTVQCSSHLWKVATTAACSLLIVGLLLVSLAYRYRWKLRYLYYASRLALQRTHRQEQQHFDYDAFVSYASQDETFVQGELQQQLEEQRGLKLCIHNRDFMPGENFNKMYRTL